MSTLTELKGVYMAACNLTVPLHIDPVLVPHVYSQVIGTQCVFIPCVIIFLLFFSMHCSERPVS
jgi:hypothetical protein